MFFGEPSVDQVGQHMTSEDRLEPTLCFQAIRESCEQYQAAVEQGISPELETYIYAVEESSQPTLLRNLLHVELQRRRRAGQHPTSAEYVSKFPEHGELISTVFFETSSLRSFAAAAQSTSGTSVNAPLPTNTPTGDLLGQYRLIRELGRGGMGMVFEARHLQRGHHVALKSLPAVDGRSLHLFKQEFRRMAEINHPHLIGLHSLEEDHGHWYFTMDLVEGTDFLSFVRPGGKLDEQRLRSVLSQLVSGVLKLHGENLIHRDLKPSNVMVSSEGRLIVLDLGLAHQSHSSGLKSFATIAGTPEYMAPEQAADGNVNGAADWYSVGVMLFEAISGKRPFVGSSGIELILRKSREDAPRLNSEQRDLEDLVGLANTLVNRDPSTRPDPSVIARVACHKIDRMVVATNRNDSGAILVGRDPQLLQLNSAFDRMGKTRSPEILFVTGRSGEGKTALVEFFLNDLDARNTEYVRLAGRCYDRESVPFKALDSLIDALASHLRRLTESQAALLMPDDISFLAHLFPVLRRVDVVSKLMNELSADLDQQQVRSRAFAALRSLLHRMTVQIPVVLFSDDLQWGDADSAEVLHNVLRGPEAPQVMLVGSFRSEEADDSPFLAKWRSLCDVDKGLPGTMVGVSALTVEECLKLAIAVVGKDTERIRQIALEFAQQTGGNALLLTELLSCFDADSDSFRVMPIQEIIRSKLERLPNEAESILDAIAVSGQSLALDEVAFAAKVKHATTSVITHMRSEKLVRLIGDESFARVDTFHDKIRETVLSQMEGAKRKQLHGMLGQAILAGVAPGDRESVHNQADPSSEELGERVFDLSYHFDAAGDHVRALKFALLAAERASGNFSQQVAADQYATARRNAVSSGPEIRFRIRKGEGHALTLLGDYNAARKCLEGAEELSSDSVEQAGVVGKLAEIAHKQGRVGDGIRLYSDALRKLGHFVPQSMPALIMSLTRETIVQAIHTVLPISWYQSNKPLSDSEKLAVELANRNSIVSYHSNTLRMIWTHIKGFNLAEKRQPSSQLAYSYGLHPAPAAAVGMPSRGLRYSDKALQIAEDSGDLLTQAHCYVMRSMAFYSSGHYPKAVKAGQKSIDLLLQTGDPFLMFIASFHLAAANLRLQNLDAAISTSIAGFEQSIRLGERTSAAGMLLCLAHATEGDFPFAEMRACFGIDPGDHFSACFVDISEAIWLLRIDRNLEAIERLDRMWSLARKQFLIIPYTVEGLAWLVMARRLYLSELPKTERALRRAHFKTAWSHIRQLRVLTLMYPCHRVFTLRETGAMLFLCGKHKKGMMKIQASIALAESQGDKQQHFLGRYELARAKAELGDQEGIALLRQLAAEKDQHRIEIAKIMNTDVPE